MAADVQLQGALRTLASSEPSRHLLQQILTSVRLKGEEHLTWLALFSELHSIADKLQPPQRPPTAWGPILSRAIALAWYPLLSVGGPRRIELQQVRLDSSEHSETSATPLATLDVCHLDAGGVLDRSLGTTGNHPPSSGFLELILSQTLRTLISYRSPKQAETLVLGVQSHPPNRLSCLLAVAKEEQMSLATGDEPLIASPSRLQAIRLVLAAYGREFPIAVLPAKIPPFNLRIDFTY